MDFSGVHPADSGYNLRPEHIESTWYLAALTGGARRVAVWLLVCAVLGGRGWRTHLLLAGLPRACTLPCSCAARAPQHAVPAPQATLVACTAAWPPA